MAPAPARSTASSTRCRKYVGIDLSVLDYSEHSMQRGSNAAAISYVEMEYPGGKLFGAGINTNIVAASLEAVVSAANRILARKA
jgi:2-isopropylmalate synthase